MRLELILGFSALLIAAQPDLDDSWLPQPKSASDFDKRKIEHEIDSAVSAKREWAAKKSELDNLWQDATRQNRITWSIVSTRIETFLLMQRESKKIREGEYVGYNIAIGLAIQAYQLKVGSMPDGWVPFEPRYSLKRGLIPRPTGPPRPETDDELSKHPGMTVAASRQVYIRPSAFVRGSDHLAETLFHELIHWRDFNKEHGVPTQQEWRRSDHQAYLLTATHAKEFGLTEDHVQWLKNEAENSLSQESYGWMSAFPDPDAPPEPGDPDYEIPVPQSELAYEDESIAPASELTASIGSLASLTEAAALGDAKRSRWRALKDWTFYACLYMHPAVSPTDGWNVYQYELEQEIRLRDYLLSNYAALPKVELTEMRSALRLDSCQRDLLDVFLAADGPINVEWMMERIDYERRGGRSGEIIRKIAEAVASPARVGANVIVAGLKLPFVVVEGIVHIYGQPGSGEGGSTSRSGGTPVTPNYSRAYGQLRGLASGGSQWQ